MNKKKVLGLFMAAAVTAAMSIIPVPAAFAAQKADTSSDVQMVTAAPTPTSTAGYFNAIARAVGNGGHTVKFEPGHTYHISGMIRVPSNTTIDATGATIIEDMPGCTMISQPDDRCNNSKIKGYNAVHDITIKGGTWVGTKQTKANATSKEGYKNGCNVVNFLHSKNITIENATLYNDYNAHIIELTGCKNCKIINCKINIKENGKAGFYYGSSNNGAIQLDACTCAANNPRGRSFDGTPCQNITISRCKIHYPSGVECAQTVKGNKITKNVTITKNKIWYKYKPYITKHTANIKIKGNKTIKY
ncbi:MAG: right-handed parallel beta-helix repeat-containing protein [Eubacterium sp.]|jgi:hypothetical protein|nr:right-handed parallel beta-helix repeat-containing protein [Eubacterium sp.]MCH4046272.1 right-handed parallel beta-helix repeat-containing protein [Eubacterium sp.]MCH4079367.1 right-handed parallel beta-helix repeat-containing protein [Eubacterium sp.]MCI1307482.1 right-handed parallel beta-helix repeat-containing protein [Eubacterium sp.]MCI1406000.1 right-handed parallel beta-helix repeat-containing protein [Eubacterium sp.]